MQGLFNAAKLWRIRIEETRTRVGQFKGPEAVLSPARVALLVVGIVLLAYVCFRVGISFAPAAFALLIVIVFVSMFGTLVESITLSIIALACLYYLFVPPVLTLRFENRQDVLAVLAFLTTSVSVATLMTKLRRLREQELRQTRADLARFARVATLGELAASIAHEVNQPLAGVVSSGNACQRWLAADPPNIDRATLSLARIIRDANRASEIIGRVRAMAKNTPAQKTMIDINEAVQEIIILTRAEIAHNRIVLRAQLATDLPHIRADRVQVQQVCLNLIINAIDALAAIEDGPREIKLATDRDEDDKVRVTVTDTGVGLDASKLDDIFEPLYTTKSDGMGMGLAISRTIIEAHNGKLRALRNQPRGAVMQFTLPIG